MLRRLGVLTVALCGVLAGCSEPPPSRTATAPAIPDEAPTDLGVPVAVEDLYDAFLQGCREQRAPLLWSLFSPALKAQIDAQAERAVRSTPATAIAREYGYHGHTAGFEGTAYLQGLLGGEPDRHPCPSADLWRRVRSGRDGEAWVVVAERPDGLHQALRCVEREGTWRIEELSRPQPPPG